MEILLSLLLREERFFPFLEGVDLSEVVGVSSLLFLVSMECLLIKILCALDIIIFIANRSIY